MDIREVILARFTPIDRNHDVRPDLGHRGLRRVKVGEDSMVEVEHVVHGTRTGWKVGDLVLTEGGIEPERVGTAAAGERTHSRGSGAPKGFPMFARTDACYMWEL
jgi:hypothetical protein